MIKIKSTKGMIILLIIGASLTLLQLIGGNIIANAPMGQFDSYVKHLDSVLMQIIFYPLFLICAVLLIFSFFSLPIGTALILFVAAPYFLKKHFSSEDNMRSHKFSACFFPLLANLYMMLQPLIFVSFPRGTAIRPMCWTALMLIVSLALTGLGLDDAIKCIKKN